MATSLRFLSLNTARSALAVASTSMAHQILKTESQIDCSMRATNSPWRDKMRSENGLPARIITVSKPCRHYGSSLASPSAIAPSTHAVAHWAHSQIDAKRCQHYARSFASPSAIAPGIHQHVLTGPRSEDNSGRNTRRQLHRAFFCESSEGAQESLGKAWGHKQPS